MVYIDVVNILGGSVHNVKKDTENLVVASKEIGLEVDAGYSMYLYMVKCRDQNAGRSYNFKIDNSSFGRVEQFKYL